MRTRLGWYFLATACPLLIVACPQFESDFVIATDAGVNGDDVGGEANVGSGDSAGPSRDGSEADIIASADAPSDAYLADTYVDAAPDTSTTPDAALVCTASDCNGYCDSNGVCQPPPPHGLCCSTDCTVTSTWTTCQCSPGGATCGGGCEIGGTCTYYIATGLTTICRATVIACP